MLTPRIYWIYNPLYPRLAEWDKISDAKIGALKAANSETALLAAANDIERKHRGSALRGGDTISTHLQMEAHTAAKHAAAICAVSVPLNG